MVALMMAKAMEVEAAWLLPRRLLSAFGRHKNLMMWLAQYLRVHTSVVVCRFYCARVAHLPTTDKQSYYIFEVSAAVSKDVVGCAIMTLIAV